MAIVAGVDFGTLSVRVTLLDSVRGRLGMASAEYPLARKRDDPDYATQSHNDQMQALVRAMRLVLEENHVDGKDIAAMALDTTGSSVRPVDAAMQPLDDYYLWCDHRARKRPGRSRAGAEPKTSRRSTGAAASTSRSGGSRSCCTGSATTPRSAPSSSRPSNIATW